MCIEHVRTNVKIQDSILFKNNIMAQRPNCVFFYKQHFKNIKKYTFKITKITKIHLANIIAHQNHIKM